MWTIVLFVHLKYFPLTFAWYGHLKRAPIRGFGSLSLPDWGIAFFEYCFQVPANRIGYTYEHWTMVNLKTIQEVITLSVFAVFAITYGGERLKWNHAAAAVCLVMAAFFVFYDKK